MLTCVSRSSPSLQIPVRALVLQGGPTHLFSQTTPLLCSALVDAGFEVDTFDDIESGLAELRRGLHGLLVVHCLRWTMKQSDRA